MRFYVPINTCKIVNILVYLMCIETDLNRLDLNYVKAGKFIQFLYIIGKKRINTEDSTRTVYRGI